jgi:MFS family permease
VSSRFAVAAPFAYRDFRWFFTGQVFNVLATWMQAATLAFVVYASTSSTLASGAVVTARLLPALLMSSWSGRLADRTGARRVAVSGRVAAAVVAVGLTVWWDAPFWVLLVLALLEGVSSAVEGPASQALPTMFLPREMLSQASGLSGSVYWLGQVLGGAVAAAMLAVLSPAFGFGATAVMFAFAAVAVGRIRAPHQPAPAEAPSGGVVSFLRADRLLLAIAAGAAVMSIPGLFAPVVFPAIAGHAASAAIVYALLLAVQAVADVAASLWVAHRPTVLPWARIPVSFVFAAMGAAALAVPVVAVQVAGAALVGVALAVFHAATGAAFQLRARPGQTGVAMSAYWTATAGVSAATSLAIGLVFEHAGVTAGLAGAAVVLAVCVPLLSRRVRDDRSQAPAGVPAAEVDGSFGADVDAAVERDLPAAA